MIRLSQRDVLKSVKDINPNSIAPMAQAKYNEWDQSDEENGDPELGFGGICDAIADGIAEYLSSLGIDANTSYSEYDTHTSVIAKLKEGVYNIDIPPSVYETGFGYNWKKIPNVTFTGNDVVFHQLDKNPENFDKYLG